MSLCGHDLGKKAVHGRALFKVTRMHEFAAIVDHLVLINDGSPVPAFGRKLDTVASHVLFYFSRRGPQILADQTGSRGNGMHHDGFVKIDSPIAVALSTGRVGKRHTAMATVLQTGKVGAGIVVGGAFEIWRVAVIETQLVQVGAVLALGNAQLAEKSRANGTT